MNTSYSVSFWIKGSMRSNTSQRFFGLGSHTTTTPVWFLESIYDGRMNMFIRNDANTTIHSSTTNRTDRRILDDNWHHVLLTDANGTVNVYIDGELDVGNLSYTRSGAFTLTRTSFGALVRTGVDGWLTGKMSDIRIWNNTIITAAQAATIYNGGIGNTSTNPSTPTSWYKCDEGSGTTLTDSGSLATNGTITAAEFSTNVAGTPLRPAVQNYKYTATTTSSLSIAKTVGNDLSGVAGATMVVKWIPNTVVSGGQIFQFGFDGVATGTLLIKNQNTSINKYRISYQLSGAGGVGVDVDGEYTAGKPSTVALRFTGSVIECWVDGILKSSTAAVGVLENSPSIGYAINSTHAPAGYANGSYVFVRAWNKALPTLDLILAIRGVKIGSPVFNMDFQEGSGNPTESNGAGVTLNGTPTGYQSFETRPEA